MYSFELLAWWILWPDGRTPLVVFAAKVRARDRDPCSIVLSGAFGRLEARDVCMHFLSCGWLVMICEVKSQEPTHFCLALTDQLGPTTTTPDSTRALIIMEPTMLESRRLAS